METLKPKSNKDVKDDDYLAYEAIISVATQIPRPGHDVVGLGTYYDSRAS